MKSNTNEAVKRKPFPIVAIGASAGGVEAISKFLESVSPDLGIAYVIIQHLSPTHNSILPEILERKTIMPVYQVTNGMEVQTDCVYVIPPNAYMSIVDGKLTLSAREKIDGVSHSIDHFLLGLAPIYQNYAIAVIFSGTASDGTEGIRAIKAE
jgi:two-component system CheB/CheR fusion protein